MRQHIARAILLFGILCSRHALCAVGDSPKEVMVTWFDALMTSDGATNVNVLDYVLNLYSSDLQDQFSPYFGDRPTTSEQAEMDKAVLAALKLHRQWISFLKKNDFTRANFEFAEEHVDGDSATVVVRSGSSVARSFRLKNLGGRWVLARLPEPSEYAALIRTLGIIVVCAIVLLVLCKKLIFS